MRYLTKVTTKNILPMGEIDYDGKQNCLTGNEEDMFLEHVVCGEHEILYLDAYLREVFTPTVN